MKASNRIKNLILTKSLFKVSEKSVLMNWNSIGELRMRCKRYSERNSTLEEILFELNKRGVKTYGSCKGHMESKGYIAFMVPPEQEDFVNQLCTRVLGSCLASVDIHECRSTFKGISVGIYFNAIVRNEVLPLLLNCIKNPNHNKSGYMQEIFKLCHIQEEIHDDLTYGVHMYPKKEGILLSPNNKFLCYSLERRISLEQLFRVCMHMDNFSEIIKGTLLDEERMKDLLHELNRKLLGEIENSSVKPLDYYAGFTEQEIVELMGEIGFYPGYLPDLISRNQAGSIREEEKKLLNKFHTEPGLYVLALKLEESLSVKRKKSLQEKKYML